MARRRDPVSGKLLVEGVYPQVSEITGAVTYRARVSYDTGAGRKHIGKTFKRAEDATDWKLKNEMRLNSGTLIAPNVITVDQYFNQWAERQRDDWTGSRYRSAMQFWRLHGKPALGNLRMQAVTRGHIQLMVDAMKETLAPSSIRAYTATARSMFFAAEDEEIIDRSPFRKIKMPKMDTPRRDIWSPLQLRVFLQKTKDHRYGPFWAFMIATGCRVSEAIALKHDSLWLDKGMVRIWRTEAVDHRGRRRVVERTKTSDTGHYVRLEPWIVDILATLPKQEYVFMHNGKRVDYELVRLAFIAAREEAGLPEITLHGLRHSVASMLSAAGVDMAIIKSIVGHTNVQTTVNTYIHTNPQGQRKGTEAAARLLGYATTPGESEGENQGDSSNSRQTGDGNAANT